MIVLSEVKNKRIQTLINYTIEMQQWCSSEMDKELCGI